MGGTEPNGAKTKTGEVSPSRTEQGWANLGGGVEPIVERRGMESSQSETDERGSAEKGGDKPGGAPGLWSSELEPGGKGPAERNAVPTLAAPARTQAGPADPGPVA